MRSWEENTSIGLGIVTILFGLGFITTYVINIEQLFSCDFREPWKDEIIHVLGLVPPLNIIAVWF